MKHLNFLSKSSSRSCGHRVTTLASTVGSPSAHRRGAMLKLLSVLAIILTIGVGQMWGARYSLTPNQSSTGSSSSSYVTTLTEFTYTSGSAVTWKMNQWNPSNRQVKGNQNSASSEFRFYNNSAFAGKITKVVITFGTVGTVSNASGFMFLGGTSAQTTTSSGTSGTWNSTAKTITWTPASSTNYTYFAFYQNGKVISGNNYLASSDAIVVTYLTDVTLNKNEGSENGAAKFDHEATAYATSSFTPAIRSNYNCTGYWTAATGGTKILNADGSIAAANITVNTVPYTDANKKWIYTAGTLTLYAQWESAGPSCSNSVALSEGTATNGTINSISEDDLETCSETASDRRVTVTITPDACFNAPDALIYTGDGTATMQGTKTDNGNGTFSYVYQFAQNDNGSGTFGVTCTAKAAGKTVIFNAGPGVPADASLTEDCAGSGITLPSVDATGVCKGWGTFVGWRATAIIDSTTTNAGTILNAGSNYVPTSDNETLYAVYSKTKGSAATWDKVTTLSGITAGTYVIVSDGCALQNTAASSSPARDATNYGVTISNDKITSTVSDAMKWSFTVANSAVTIKSFANSNNYLYNTSGNTGVRVGATSDTWTFEVNTSAPAFAMYDATNSRYCCSTISTYNDWRSYTSAAASNYRDNGKIYLYKQSGGAITYYCSDPNCCTELGSINGSVSWSNDGTSLTVKSWGYTKGTGAAESNISKYTVYLYSDNDSYAASIDNADCTVANRASTGVTFDGLSYARTYKVKITATPADGYCPVDDVWSSDTYKLTCATPTAATAGSFARATQKMPISWTSGAGKVDICYSSNSSTPAATPGSGYAVVSNQTSSPVNLDVFGLAAGNYYCWVRSVCDASNKSNWTAITGNTFTIPTHTLTITKDGGGSSTITPASGTAVVEGRTASVEASPATGYKFVNWAVGGTNAELSSTTDNPTTFTMGTADATVTGTFGLISYKVRFNKNNDDATGSMDDQTFTYGESKELSANAFELTNYTFSGWATTQEGAVAHEDEAEVENLSTADGAIVNLYAVWTANSHSVTYVANDKTDGTVPTDANSPYNHNAQVTVLGGGTLEKEHYAFVGWTDGVTNYVAGNKFTITDDVTLSARWTCDEKVTVSEGTPTNGSFTLDNSGVLATCDAAVVVTVSPSANPGYEFDAITVNGVGTKDDNAKKVTYAQNTSGTSEINVTFKAKSLSVTWNLNYEGAPDPTEVSYTYDGSSLTLPEPVREGYTFDGWFTATEDGDKIDNVGGTNKPSANVEYFAHWSPISCDVVWKVNGVTWTPKTTTGEGQDGSANANYDAKVSQLPTPPTNADGCGDRFMGWTATENYKGNSAPADLFNDVEHAPLIKANPTTYYAVFADYVE